jgi:hypothetical protein
MRCPLEELCQTSARRRLGTLPVDLWQATSNLAQLEARARRLPWFIISDR